MDTISMGNRVNVLKCMHYIMTVMNDENAYFDWIDFMPDSPTDDDFAEVASDDDLFNRVTLAFMDICKSYGAYGVFVD